MKVTPTVIPLLSSREVFKRNWGLLIEREKEAPMYMWEWNRIQQHARKMAGSQKPNIQSATLTVQAHSDSTRANSILDQG